jgi:hypothetical protein
MDKIKVKERDLYLLLAGVLFAFFIQVAYEVVMNGIIEGKIVTAGVAVQLVLLIATGLGTMRLFSKLKIEK